MAKQSQSNFLSKSTFRFLVGFQSLIPVPLLTVDPGSWQLATSFLKLEAPDVVSFGRIANDLESWTQACALLQEIG